MPEPSRGAVGSKIVAQPTLGFAASDLSPGFSGPGTATQCLTPWRNDPVTDLPGEAIYIADEEGSFLVGDRSCPPERRRRVHDSHGHGYTPSTSTRARIDRWAQVAAAEGNIKVFQHDVAETSSTTRRPSVDSRSTRSGSRRESLAHRAFARRHQHRSDDGTRLLARKRISRSVLRPPHRVPRFYAGRRRPHAHRRSKRVHRPQRQPHVARAMTPRASRSHGATLDDCGVDPSSPSPSNPRPKRNFIGLLGESARRREVSSLVRRQQRADKLSPPRSKMCVDSEDNRWDGEVRTPDRSLDLLLNGWLLIRRCRAGSLGDSAFLQSSGAFGFRESVQDVIVLLAAPHLARNHIFHARHGSSSKATCSTGGTSTGPGCPHPLIGTSGGASLRGAPLRPTTGNLGVRRGACRSSQDACQALTSTRVTRSPSLERATAPLRGTCVAPSR